MMKFWKWLTILSMALHHIFSQIIIRELKGSRELEFGEVQVNGVKYAFTYPTEASKTVDLDMTVHILH